MARLKDSFWHGAGQRNGGNSMFERGIGHGYHNFVRRLAISFDNDRSVLAFRGVEQRAEAIDGYFLVPEINRRDRAPGNADDLLVLLRAEKKGRRRRRN